MRWSVAVALFAGLGCSEYNVKGTADPVEGSSETEEETTDWTSSSTDPADPCDGEDNDGDGEVDEGYPDEDLDGVADCVDQECVVELTGPGEVPTRSECEGDEPIVIQDPWNVALEWGFDAGGSIVVSPVTGQLTDDNGDGMVNHFDIPDVAFTSYSNGNLYILSGDGSGPICTQAGWRTDGGVIIADVDSDGENEVVGPLTGGQIRAVNGACVTEWTSAQSYTLLYPVTTAADLNADGVVEVISDVAVVDGRNGSAVFTLAPANSSCWRAPFTGDIDQDGDVEVILGPTVFSSNGAPMWSAQGGGTSCFGGLANLDADPEAEVLISYGYDLIAHEHDGTPIWNATLAVPNPGPLCAGDIDGDSEVEVIVPNGVFLTAYEADGAVKWSAPMLDASGAAGCVVFDMNGDLTYEVLFADEDALRLYDGLSGNVLWQNGQHGSVTYFETPTVADIDNDGSAEMLVVNSSGIYGLTVFGHNGSGWPASGPTWGLHDFSATNQLPDGTIPQSPVAPWLQYNVFRGRPYDDVPGAPNLVGEVTDLCVSSCQPRTGIVSLAVQIANDGGTSSGATNASLYLVDPASGGERLYDTRPVDGTSAGDVLPSVVFDVKVKDWTGEYVIRVDDDGSRGAVGECYEDDNEIRGAAEICP
jgi:hypothetical protein